MSSSSHVRRTSVAAYRSLVENKKLSKKRREVYAWLYRFGPCTGSELWVAGCDDGSSLVHANIRARLGELRDLGVVAEVGERVCRVTEKSCIVWDVTDRENPLPARRKTTAKQRLKRMTVLCLTVADWLDSIGGATLEAGARRIRDRVAAIEEPKEEEK